MKNNFVKKIELLGLILSAILIGASMYLIGNMNAIESQSSSIQIVYPDTIATKTTLFNQTPEVATDSLKADIESVVPKNGKIIASKNGKRYYYSHCGGINRIKPENKIYFDTKEQAEAKGLTLASGCKPL